MSRFFRGRIPAAHTCPDPTLPGSCLDQSSGSLDSRSALSTGWGLENIPVICRVSSKLYCMSSRLNINRLQRCYIALMAWEPFQFSQSGDGTCPHSPFQSASSVRQWLDTGISVAGGAADVGWGRRPWMLDTDVTTVNPSPVSQALDLITSGNNRHCYPHSQMMRLNLKEVKLWLKVIELFDGKKSELIPRSPSQGNHKAPSDSLSPHSILGFKSLFSGDYNFTGKTHNSLGDSDLAIILWHVSIFLRLTSQFFKIKSKFKASLVFVGIHWIGQWFNWTELTTVAAFSSSPVHLSLDLIDLHAPNICKNCTFHSGLQCSF